MLRRIFSSRTSLPLGIIQKISTRNIFIQTEPTPNEDALIFKPGQEVLGGSKTVEFTSPQQAARKSRLAAELFTINGVSSIMFGPDFISVNKRPDALWIHLKPMIFSALMDQFTMFKGQPIMSEQETGGSEDNSMAVKDTDSEVVKAVKEILESRVRPVIQGDGGDLSYEGFDEATGTVKLKLQGACRSCSSSVVTLKNGIENMLKFYVPEVKQVLQVEDATEAASEKAFEAFEKAHSIEKKNIKDSKDSKGK